MPLSGENEPMCPKFQPNIFDPSRCHDCLRQKHLHSGSAAAAEESTEAAAARPQSHLKHLHSGSAAAAEESTEAAAAPPQSRPSATNSGTGSGIATGNGIGIIGPLPHKGAPSQQAAVPSKAEGKDTSSKEDSDGVSVVSSYCDVRRGRAGYGESSLCIVSPDCNLYLCDQEEDDSDIDSTDSGRDELCGSVSAEEDDYPPPLRRHSTHPSMTRLDPPPHRPNPRVWMEEARSKDRFGRHSGSSEERGNRESGYFSLGKAAGGRSIRDQSPGPALAGARSIRDQSPGPALAGARSIRDQSPVTAFRHYERGHPLYSTRSIEPKDIIPFRNQGLGVASERQPPELPNEDLPDEILPPDPYEVAIEVEAQVGPRSPSPTPFKIAESLASVGGRRGGGNSSYGRGNLSSNTSSHQQTGRFDSSRQGSALQSRSASPSQGNVPFRRSESTTSLNKRNFDGGGRSQGGDQRAGSLSQRLGRGVESETLPSRNFKSISDLSSSLQVNGSLTGRGGHRRSSSPPKRDCNSTGQTSLRKAESRSSLLNGRGRDSRPSSPPRSSLLNGRGRDSRPSSPPRSSLLNGRGRDMTSSSPPRRDYNSTGQTSLRKAESSSSLLNGRGRDSRPSSPPRRTCEPQNSTSPRRSYNSPSQSVLRKSESANCLNGRGHHGRCGSPIREGYDIESQAKMRNPELWNATNDQEPEMPGSSPARRDYNVTSQIAVRKTQSSGYGGGRGCDSRASSPGRRSSEGPSQYLLKKADAGGSNARGLESRNCSPSRKGYDAPSGQSLLRKAETNGSARSYSRGQDSRSSSPSRRGYEAPGHSSLRKTETSSSLSGGAFNSQSSSPSRSGKAFNSPSSSPSRRGNNDPPGYSILRTAASGESMCSSQRKSTSYSDKRSDPNHASRTNPSSSPPPPRVRESNHSLRNSSSSRAASPTRQATESSRTAFSQRTATATMQASRSSSGNRAGGGGGGRRSPETRCSSPSDKRPSFRIRSPSPSPQDEMRRHSSSQSSMESSESGHLSAGSTGRNREEYAAMADLPKVKIIHQGEGPGYVGQTQNNGPAAATPKLFKPASHSVCKQPSKWEEPGGLDRDHAGWHHEGSGRLSRAQSSTSLHMQRSSSPIEENGSWTGHHHQGSDQMQPDLLNFKKGWMSKLDESGEWKKHWFVLSDAGLKYYRDSGAEEKDDLDGEIDLKSCVKVSEFDVEKNYGFQIQTREAVFTLSAMTAGIRRNWIEVLRKSVRPISSPDLTLLPDSSSDKENSHARPLSSVSRRPPPPSRHGDSRSSATPASAPSTPRRFDYVELSPVPVPSHPLPTSQREAGEGQGREHNQWQEQERNKDATTSTWEAVLSRKGHGGSGGSDPRLQTEEDIERKWAEFERMPLTEMRSLPSVGSRPSSQSANEALQREVASLRQQVERLHGGGGGGKAGGGEGGRAGEEEEACGPEAPCGRSLSAMERAHRQALEELQKQHQRQTRELEAEKDRLLLEESQATAQVMQALRKAHKEEMEREVEKAKRLNGGLVDSQTLRSHQQAETHALQRELAGLSERYSQKCLELNRAEQNNAEREREVCRKERDIEQLRKENQDLQTRLKEEIRRMRAVISGQGSSEAVSNDNRDRTSCELEVLLRVKENEVEYLHKEIGCLRNELQFLNTEKRVACDRYKELHEELSGMKGRSEREIHNLKENLRLAMAALQEGQMLGNSLDH